MPGPLPPWNLFLKKICFLVLYFSGFFNPFCSFCFFCHKTCWRWKKLFKNSVVDFFVWCASVIVSDQTAIMGGTLKRRRGESWFPLIWSQPPAAACLRRLNPTNHNLVIPICNYHLRAPNNQVMCCNVTFSTIHRLLCPSIEADAAQQEREFLSSNSHYFRAGGAPPIQVGKHHLSRWRSTTCPGATWFYVGNNFWGEFYSNFHPRTLFGRDCDEIRSMSGINYCQKSIYNPFGENM